MLKYDPSLTKVCLSTIPDEVTLVVPITGCQIQCPDCHSKFLWKEYGAPLYTHSLVTRLKHEQYISCVCLFGGEHNLKYLENVFKELSNTKIKLAWFNGLDPLDEQPIDDILMELSYVKFGAYIANCGGLEDPNTNQMLLRYMPEFDKWEDITCEYQRFNK